MPTSGWSDVTLSPPHGVTSLVADVQDVYVEHVNARNEAEFKGAWEPKRMFQEVIRVKGAPDERLTVRWTRHGPLVSDVLPGATAALALRWTALDDEDNTADWQYALGLASNWEQFTVALSRLRSPSLNIV